MSTQSSTVTSDRQHLPAPSSQLYWNKISKLTITRKYLSIVHLSIYLLVPLNHIHLNSNLSVFCSTSAAPILNFLFETGHLLSQWYVNLQTGESVVVCTAGLNPASEITVSIYVQWHVSVCTSGGPTSCKGCNIIKLFLSVAYFPPGSIWKQHLTTWKDLSNASLPREETPVLPSRHVYEQIHD